MMGLLSGEVRVILRVAMSAAMLAPGHRAPTGGWRRFQDPKFPV
jgi:hypothetical protein